MCFGVPIVRAQFSWLVQGMGWEESVRLIVGDRRCGWFHLVARLALSAGNQQVVRLGCMQVLTVHTSSCRVVFFSLQVRRAQDAGREEDGLQRVCAGALVNRSPTVSCLTLAYTMFMCCEERRRPAMSMCR